MTRGRLLLYATMQHATWLHKVTIQYIIIVFTTRLSSRGMHYTWTLQSK